MANTSSINSDNRRRTMEVSATMLRDILIGYKETDGQGDVSFDDRLTNGTRNRGNAEQPFPNNRAKSEEKSRKVLVFKIRFHQRIKNSAIIRYFSVQIQPSMQQKTSKLKQ